MDVLVPNIQDIVDKYLVDKYEERQKKYDFYRREIGTYHASDIGWCPLLIYFRYKKPKLPSVEAMRRFIIGRHIEYIIQKSLSYKYGNNVRHNVKLQPINLEDFKIVCEVDSVINVDGIKVPIEIKSWRYVNNMKKPKSNHLLQLHTYLTALGSKYGRLIYVDKADLTIKEFGVSFSNIWKNLSLMTVTSIHRALVNDTPEILTRDTEFCRYCDYQEECKSI